MTRILITGAGGAAAVALLHALGAGGFELYAAAASSRAAGLYLVPAARRCHLPPGMSVGFLAEVRSLCARLHIDLLIPTDDDELAPIARARAQLEANGTRVLVASSATLRRCHDKLALARLAAAVVPVPRTAALDDHFDPTGWTFPLIVRARQGRGVHRIDDAATLARVERPGERMVQELAPGLEYAVDVLATQLGRVIAAVPHLRLEEEAGAAVGCTVRDGELEDLATRMASLIGLTGVASVRFRRDRSGVPRLLAIDPRFPATVATTVAAGVDMPGFAVRDVLGLPLPVIDGFREVGMVQTWRETVVPIAELDVPSRDTLGAEVAP